MDGQTDKGSNLAIIQFILDAKGVERKQPDDAAIQGFRSVTINKEYPVKITPAAIFSFCALIFFCVFVYIAQEWRLQARLYPYAIGIPMLILAIVQVILDLKGVKAKESSTATPMDFQFTKGTDPIVARNRAIIMFAWLIGFFLLIWLVGFPIGIAVMVFTYLKFQGRESWKLSIVLTVIAWLCFWGLFVRLLHLPFPEGLIFTWLGIEL